MTVWQDSCKVTAVTLSRKETVVHLWPRKINNNFIADNHNIMMILESFSKDILNYLESENFDLRTIFDIPKNMKQLQYIGEPPIWWGTVTCASQYEICYEA